MAAQGKTRERLGPAARWFARCHISVVAILAMVAVPVLPQAAAAAAATARPVGVLTAPPPGPVLGGVGVSIDAGPGGPVDNTADETPGTDSVQHDQSAPPMTARFVALDRETPEAVAPFLAAARLVLDDGSLVGVYRCNPDERGPPRRV